ncbi:MAG TPA: NHL repeat-containing protein [Ktedonobacteraceae bacterium]|nr:NHL repeat-containing protein [Ktedonobacteraceae bacterium]
MKTRYKQYALRGATWGSAISVLMFLLLSNEPLWLQGRHIALAAGVSPTALSVYGQGGSFTSSTANYPINAATLNRPWGSFAVDSGGNLYIADTNNNRVLYYAAGSTTATRVYGQGGSFTSDTSNNGGRTASSLSAPRGIALDSSGNLYVVDTNNNRVLYYTAGSTTATRVYGQGGSFTTGTYNNGGRSANSLGRPTGVTVDSSGNVYIADNLNNRVLYYAAGSTTATRVYGQDGSFTTANSASITATSLNTPAAVALDSSGNVYIADTNNNRVLYYVAGSTTATRIYGQGGSFTTANNSDVNATSLNLPQGVAVDSSGNVYIADSSNNRVLYYVLGSTTATRVYGQGGSFTTNTTNTGGRTANSLSLPLSVIVDSGGNLYVADTSNHRVLYYVAGSTTATRVYGQGGSFTTGTYYGNASASNLYGSQSIAVDSSGNLFTVDTNNNRVLYYVAGSTTATRVYGQGGNFTTNTFNTGGRTATSLSRPTGATVDSSGNLYIADANNNRVLYYTAGSTTATRVYGQGGSFTTANSVSITANSLNTPSAVAIDSSGNLYIADTNNNRVLYYAAGSTTATRVYGQGGSFTSNAANNGGVTATSLNAPQGVAVDSSGNLYIADNGNNRVLYYAAGSTTAIRVYGQGGSFTSNVANNGGVTATSLNAPQGVIVDSGGNLYIADANNNRVLYYVAGSTTARRVYGQGGSFIINTANSIGGVTASSLDQPEGVAVDSSGNIYVADNLNNRVLTYQTALSISTQPPTGITPGSTFGLAAQLIDVGSGQIFTDFSGPVTVAINAGTGTGGATLSGTTSLAASNGVATFSNLTIDIGGAGYVLTVSSPGSGSAMTTAFNIVGGLFFTPLTNLSFTFTLNGTIGTVTSQSIFKVNDTTASGLGWHTTITSTQFSTIDGKRLPTTALTITGVSAACTAGQTCVVPVNGVNSYPITVPAATTAPAAITYFSANGNTGTGDVTLTVTYSLSIPPGTASGTYTSTLTETLVKH